MAEAGCDFVFLGLETGSQRLQAAIGKRLQVDEIVATVRLLAERGIEVVTSFVTGFPEETQADLAATAVLMASLRYCAHARPVTQQVHLLAPLAGSPLFEQYHAALELDEFRSDITCATVDADDLELARRHPALFSSFHHYPTPHLPRQVAVRVPFLLQTLQYFEHGLFLLWRDATLDFPAAFLGSAALLALPGERANRGIGDPEGLRRVVPSWRPCWRSGAWRRTRSPTSCATTWCCAPCASTAPTRAAWSRSSHGMSVASSGSSKRVISARAGGAAARAAACPLQEETGMHRDVHFRGWTGDDRPK